ncbi:MAG: hypothetical protein H0W99_12330 [Acidobacteria bacterium]|nr:hypothetical protein [Acidobacteriota bacterium]
MKRCPTCSRTYTDDALSFCLDDGGPLLSVGGDAPSSFDPNATLAYPAARDTSPPPEAHPSRVQPPNQAIQPPASNWSPGPSQMNYPQPARKKSALPWILGGAAVLLVLGIGLVALIAIVATMSSTSNSSRSNTNVSRTSSNSRTTNTSNTSSGSSGSTLVVRDDFSSEKWSSDGNENKYEDSEYHMHSSTGNYIVVLAPDQSDYYTKNRTVRATARSVDGTASSYGYGVVVHGMLKSGEPVGYSFLVYTGNDPSYAVFHLTGDQDRTLVKWTSSTIVRSGSNSNQLEVRIKGDQLS